MARKKTFAKMARKPKFPSRAKNRCKLCGRGRAFIGDFDLCRHCFRNLALDGELPGVRKASW